MLNCSIVFHHIILSRKRHSQGDLDCLYDRSKIHNCKKLIVKLQFTWTHTHTQTPHNHASTPTQTQTQTQTQTHRHTNTRSFYLWTAYLHFTWQHVTGRYSGPSQPFLVLRKKNSCDWPILGYEMLWLNVGRQLELQFEHVLTLVINKATLFILTKTQPR